jgi:hypothetical protein
VAAKYRFAKQIAFHSRFRGIKSSPIFFQAFAGRRIFLFVRTAADRTRRQSEPAP